MYLMKRASVVMVCALALAGGARIFGGGSAFGAAIPQPQQAAQNAAKQVIGAIQAISGSTITLKPDTGADVSVTVQGAVRVLRVAPGQTDLKTATPIQLSDLQVGDRILVRGTPSADGQSLSASAIVAMKRSDVEAKQQQEREDWQKRGIGGLVSAVDASAGTITISVTAAGGTRTVSVHTAAGDDFSALRSGFGAVRRRETQFAGGDQGGRPASRAGSAERGWNGVYRGRDRFRGVPEYCRHDQQRRCRHERAHGDGFGDEEAGGGEDQRAIATIEAAAADGSGHGDAVEGRRQRRGRRERCRRLRIPGGAAGRRRAKAPGMPGARDAGAADLQQVMNRIPKATIADMQKGDAVMIVSTEGTSSGGVTAITLLSGVEPILQAPSGQSMTLPPWNLGGGGEDAGEGNP